MRYDHLGYDISEDMLLPLKGYVTESELRSPPDTDANNNKALLAVKNGRTTGTTFGRVNGLESITRTGTSHPALELIVCGYDKAKDQKVAFSELGDSGAIVAGRDGRVIGLLTGGRGPTGSTDLSYVTPYYALKEVLDHKFPGFHLLDVDTQVT